MKISSMTVPSLFSALVPRILPIVGVMSASVRGGYLTVKYYIDINKHISYFIDIF